MISGNKYLKRILTGQAAPATPATPGQQNNSETNINNDPYMDPSLQYIESSGFLSEVPTEYFLIGGALLIGGIVLLSGKKKGKK